MRNRRPPLLVVFVLILCLALLYHLDLHSGVISRPVLADSSPEAESEYVPGVLLVKFRDGSTSSKDAARVFSAWQLAAATPVPELNLWKLKTTPGNEWKELRALQNLPEVEYAELNYIVHAQETPNDPYFYMQWGLDQIDAPEGWDFAYGSSSVIIAIIDTGIDGTHPDLSSKVLAGYNFVSSRSILAGANSDDNSHGTHVAGIVAAVTNNSIGVAGVSWEASLMPVKVLDSSGSGTYEDVALGVRYAADNGAKIISMSLGGSDYSQTLESAVDYAYNKGCLLTAASGNNGSGTLLYPARYDNVMGVGRTDSADQRYWSSNYGVGLNVMAPGSSIYSTIPGSSYGYKSGTSMACPFVSGLAALVWSVAPDYSNVQVQQLIEDNAVDLGSPGWDQYYGYGRIDALATLQQFGHLLVSPTDFTFLADSQVGSVPSSANVTVQTSVQSAGVISWTTVISPESTTWLTATPGVGAVSGSIPASIQVGIDTNGLDYGFYACELLVATASGSQTFTSSVEISLNYVEELNRYFLIPILKNEILPD